MKKLEIGLRKQNFFQNKESFPKILVSIMLKIIAEKSIQPFSFPKKNRLPASMISLIVWYFWKKKKYNLSIIFKFLEENTFFWSQVDTFDQIFYFRSNLKYARLNLPGTIKISFLKFVHKKIRVPIFFWMRRGAKLTNQRPVLRPFAHAKNHIFGDKNQTITFSRYFLLFAKWRV